MFGTPGSLTMYSTACRPGLPPPNDTPPTIGPATYYVKPVSCRPCVPENVAPFNTTGIRRVVTPNGYPSPSEYLPYIQPRYASGSPIMRGRHRFPHGQYWSCGPGPAYKVRDPWIALVEECQDMTSKRWRVPYKKYKSTNCPSVFHPLELRTFISGLDGRTYPVRNKNWGAKIPGPIYNTLNIRTSRSQNPRIVDFSHSKGRPPLFKISPGFGPADFTIPRDLNRNGGIFLSKSDCPEWSTYRLFDFIVCKTSKTIYPSPFDHYVRGGLDSMSPKAVSAPFKSTVPRLGYDNKFITPSPLDYFKVVLTPDDLDPPVYPRNPSYFTFPPEPPPFNCTQERFYEPRLIEEFFNRPSPADYDIPSFTDLLWCECKCNIPALCNPKLGFLTSADARPEKKYDTCPGGSDDEPRKWRNMRPRKRSTYPYHGPPPKYPDSPGPIYDTNPPCKAVKARREWWDPRRIVDMGFNNSGCTRKMVLTDIDPNIPGPGLYYANKPPVRCMTGNFKITGPRVAKHHSFGPGPRHKLHDKVSSSTWRGTHLGTFNIYLKGVRAQRPSAGGFRPHGPLDKLGDDAAGICRDDQYLCDLCPTEIKKQL
ncbi:unnamed protein product [Allacma fusca]|uniref:Uncharacterized protein n=1 Tax=Allacma fusca TaxID=39272 RepID=A0A8J2J3W3_9HEXA|nr:unnamed protein product [Allacma fusca]